MSPIILAIIILLGIILAIIAFIVILKSSNKATSKPIKSEKVEDDFGLDALMDVVKNPNSSSNDVMNALIYFNENFNIDDKNDRQALLFFSRALTHPNKSKNIFQYFHREIKPKNLQFINELESIEKKALG